MMRIASLAALVALLASNTGCITLLSSAQGNRHHSRSVEYGTMAAGGFEDLASGAGLGMGLYIAIHPNWLFSKNDTSEWILLLLGLAATTILDYNLWKSTDQDRHYGKR